jgi:hypothetical protein
VICPSNRIRAAARRKWAAARPLYEDIPMSEPSNEESTRCMFLCCKSMMVYGEAFESDPDFQAGIVDFWCTRTSKNRGPDGGTLSLPLCSDSTRSCYKEY